MTDGNFGSRFPWYVDNINRKMSQNWNKSEVDPHTPKGARVYITYTIHRDGSPAMCRSTAPAAVPPWIAPAFAQCNALIPSAPLPAGYNSSTLKVSYYCEY